MLSLSESETLASLPLRPMMAALEQVLEEYGRGAIASPQRLAMPCGPGDGGVLLSMPCGARDLVIHKLLTVYGANPAAGRPAIQGQVAAFDAGTGAPLFTLDGPAVTARRTAAVSMLAIARLHPGAPGRVALIGTGAQARAHVVALRELFPRAEIRVRGTSRAKEDAFVAACGDDGALAPLPPGAIDADVVIAATGSATPVYDAAAAAGRLVIGVGAYRLDMVEIGHKAIAGSQVYVDDPFGAPSEAGDLAAAGVDWAMVRPLAEALSTPPDFARPVLFKSVGCAAWDLAACRAARAALAL